MGSWSTTRTGRNAGVGSVGGPSCSRRGVDEGCWSRRASSCRHQRKDQSFSAGAKSYYNQGLSREDYYSQGEEIAGRWGGLGAARLGLQGQVTKERFDALCDNREPATGESLTRRTKGNRTVGYDLNFHCPKSVSVLSSQTGDERILGAFRSAVGETMREIETEIKTRVRKAGQNAERTTGNRIWAEFVHFTARPVEGTPDPHLHAHCFTFNATYDEHEGTWKAGQFRDLVRDAPYFEEERLIAFAREGRGACRPLGKTTGHEFQNGFLSPEQQCAVRHVLESPDRVILLRGGAGTGKTTLMQEAVAGIELNGKRVLTFAPSADVSRGVLREEGFQNAETVARLLQDPKLQAGTKGQVIWIEVAGQLGTRTMGKVFALAEEQAARVVLSGDVRQHGAVERGDALRVLEQQAGIRAAEIKTIRRQRGAYKEAVAAISRGDLAGGFDRLDAMGCVREIKDGERHKQLARDDLDAAAAKKTALIVSPTHFEGDQVTGLIRGELRNLGSGGPGRWGGCWCRCRSGSTGPS